MSFEHSVAIEAPAAAVWALTIDVERLPDLTPTMERVRLLDPPLAVGSRVEITQPGDRPRTWTVAEITPERRFVWTTSAAGTTMRATHEIAPTGETTCTNTLRIELSGWAAPLLRRAMASKIERNLAEENGGFASAANRGGAAQDVG